MNWFSPTTWLLYGALAAALVLGAWRLDAARQQVGYDRAQAEYTTAALAAERAARAKEQELQTKVQKVSNEYQTEKIRRATDARVAAGRLRDLEAALAAAAATDTTAPSGTDDPRDTIIGQCAGALVRLDEYAKGVASTATALQNYAREVCVAK